MFLRKFLVMFLRMKKSGLAAYEKDFINYAREHHLSYSAMMK